jgi:hypothetical protein
MLRLPICRALFARLSAALVIGLLILAGASQPQADQNDPVLTLILADSLAPIHVTPGADGANHLVYELVVTNITGGLATLRAVDVFAQDGTTVLATLDTDAIVSRFERDGRRGNNSDALEGGRYGVLFMHVAIPADQPVPTALRHRLIVDLEGMGEGIEIPVHAMPIAPLDIPVLGAPFIGENYIAADGCCDSVRHIRALLPINAQLRLAQRFAIDWEQVDDTGRLVNGDLSVPQNYVIYGKPALAVADGEVVGTLDGLPDQIPGDLPEGLTFAESDGNHVVLKIAEGVYVLYAHFAPGSVTVKVGDHVTRGEVLGLVGNSGNTSAPHLHLHVMDGPSALDANGLPYVFESFLLTAINNEGTEAFDLAETTGAPVPLDAITPPVLYQSLLVMDQ